MGATGPSGGSTKTVVGVLASDQTFTNNTTLTNLSSSLNVTMGASDTWVVRWTLYVTNTLGGSGGVQVAVTVPTGATLQATGTVVGINGSGDCFGAETTTSGTALHLSTNSRANGVLDIVASVIGDGIHSGTIAIQGAQQSANATSTVFKAGSSMLAIQQ